MQGDRPEIQREADYAQRILYVICVLLNGEGYEATWNELVAYVYEVEGVREVLEVLNMCMLKGFGRIWKRFYVFWGVTPPPETRKKKPEMGTGGGVTQPPCKFS